MNTLTRARIVITAGVLSVAALLGAVAASMVAAPAVHHAHVLAGDPPIFKP
jgi:Flp pilus assembly protein CpaB